MYLCTLYIYVWTRSNFADCPAPILFKFCRIRDEFVLSSGTEDPIDLGTSADPAKILAMIINAQYAYYRHARRVELYNNIILCKIVCARLASYTLVVRPLKIIFLYYLRYYCVQVPICICVYYYIRVPNHRIFVIIPNICHPEYDLLLFLENARLGNFDKSFFAKMRIVRGESYFFWTQNYL